MTAVPQSMVQRKYMTTIPQRMAPQRSADVDTPELIMGLHSDNCELKLRQCP